MPTIITDRRVFFYRRDSWLSNHHPAPFVVKGRSFATVEQFYYYAKACICGETLMAEAILRESDPAKNKRQDRAMRCHDEAPWQAAKLRIMEIGTYHKYNQNLDLLAKLMSTQGNEIVEASPNLFWGCGIDIYDPALLDAATFPGHNNLGHIISKTRSIFAETYIDNQNRPR